MKPEFHLEAFEERKETMIRWGVGVRGIENSQRVIGDNASKAITELLSAYLHKKHKIDEGTQLNHTWFKSEKVSEKLPEFENKENIVGKMIKLERLCERLSYGVPKPVENAKEALRLFEAIENKVKAMMQ